MQVYHLRKVQIFICKSRRKKLGQITQKMDYSICKNHFSKTSVLEHNWKLRNKFTSSHTFAVVAIL